MTRIIDLGKLGFAILHSLSLDADELAIADIAADLDYDVEEPLEPDEQLEPDEPERLEQPAVLNTFAAVLGGSGLGAVGFTLGPVVGTITTGIGAGLGYASIRYLQSH